MEAFANETFAQPDLIDFYEPLGPRIIIVGAGPVGLACAKGLIESYKDRCHIAIFNGENYAPYDRIKLTQLLTREVNYPDIFWSSDFANINNEPPNSLVTVNASVNAIDVDNKQVLFNKDESLPYDFLILATGSKPHIPNIKGIDLPGVYTFRNLRDTEFLMARTHRSRHTIVVGGGLLGLEAAKALRQKNTLVTLVHQGPYLMNRQLNSLNAKLLLSHVEDEDIQVILSDGLGSVHGVERVTGISTRQGKIIECDTIVLCTGIKPNIDLANASGINFNKGIVVNDKLETSSRNIYAIGECCEHKGEIFGLVGPGLEQAAIIADNISGGSATFSGSQPYSKLKVLDYSVSSLGDVVNLGKRPKLSTVHFKNLSTKNNKKPVTRSLVLQGDFIFGYKLLGACGIGDWPELQRLRETLTQDRKLYFWQLLLFRIWGRLWINGESANPNSWPASLIICQCNQVSKQKIVETISNGCSSLSSVANQCGAGAVCGSCQPSIKALIDHQYENSKEPPSKDPVSALGKALIFTSAFSAALVFLLALLPELSTPNTVQNFSLTEITGNKLFKQISGFTLLGLVAIGLILSLRKRLNWSFLGQFKYWRLVHTITGLAALAILFGHTGASLGDNLNRILMMNFLLIAFVGSLLGIVISFAQTAHKIRLRAFSFWFHVLAAWPLPILVSAHIFSSYYY